MDQKRSISSDPSKLSLQLCAPCFVCKNINEKKKTALATVTDSQFQLLALAELKDVSNSSRRLNIGRLLLLCASCRGNHTGLNAITNCDPAGDLRSLKAIKAWRNRYLSSHSFKQNTQCHTCLSDGRISSQKEQSRHDDVRASRNPTVGWTILNIVHESYQSLQGAFSEELQRLSGCSHVIAAELLADSSNCYLCYVHLNHCRTSQRVARRTAGEQSTVAASRFIFTGKDCKATTSNSKSRLRRIPTYRINDLKNLEEFSQIEEIVHSHSNGKLHAVDDMGEYCCRSCWYIVLEGKKCAGPKIGISTLKLTVDRQFIRCVLFALATEDEAQKSVLFSGESTKEVAEIAANLRNGCNTAASSGFESVRLLRFGEVRKLRFKLGELLSHSSGKVHSNIDERTLVTRLEPVLSGRGVILKNLGYKVRCYVTVKHIDELLSGLVERNSYSTYITSWPSPSQIGKHLDTVAKRFKDMKSRYWDGRWTLS